jgi:aspartyl-tRNA(Asn)/glutamyl-tRNA(Gln) amidotransferase subunit A
MRNHILSDPQGPVSGNRFGQTDLPGALLLWARELEPMRVNEVLDSGVAAIVGAVRARQVSPLELVEVCMARIRDLEPHVNAFITISDEQARDHARALECAIGRGENVSNLAGVPFALKDNFDATGLPTTAGSQLQARNIAAADSEVAARLRRAGAVLIGKLNMHEWAIGGTTQNPFFGACHNPWDLTRIPGGSSGGSGAAVGARMIPVAMGSDTGGSVRIPAALNGVSGLRPTFGRVSRRGLVPMSWTFDVPGPLAHSVEDLAWMLRELAGFDAEDSGSEHVPGENYVADLETNGGGVQGLKVGLLTGTFRKLARSDVWDAIVRVCDTLSDLGARVEEIDGSDVDDLGECMRDMMMAEAVAFHHERLRDQPEMFGPDVFARLRAGAEITGVQYARAREMQRVWRRRYERTFERYPLLLAPTCPVPAPTIAEADGVETTRLVGAFTYGFSLLGVPVLSVPCGLSIESLPIGVQLIGAWWHERQLLRVGHAYQRATSWHLATPPLVNPGVQPKSPDAQP